MIAKAAFGWPAGRIMLHSISGKHLHPTVVHPDRDADDKRSLREFEPLSQIGIQMHGLGSLIKLRDGQSECGGIEFSQG